MSTKPSQVNLLILLQSVALAIGPVAIAMDRSHAESRTVLDFVNLLLLIYFTWKMSQGRNWARIVLLVLFLFGLPLYPIHIREEFGRSATIAVLSLAQGALEGAALFLAFTAPAKDWFKKPAEPANA
jgi:hypothetical protein